MKRGQLQEMVKLLATLREEKKSVCEREKALTYLLIAEMVKAKVDRVEADGVSALHIEAVSYSVDPFALQGKVGWKDALACCSVSVTKVRDSYGQAMVEELGESETKDQLRIERRAS